MYIWERVKYRVNFMQSTRQFAYYSYMDVTSFNAYFESSIKLKFPVM